MKFRNHEYNDSSADVLEIGRNKDTNLDMILRHLPDAMFAIDVYGRVLVWNDRMEELTGVRRKDIIGQKAPAYAHHLYADSNPILIDLVRNNTTGRRRSSYELFLGKGETLYAEGFVPSAYGGKGAYVNGTATPFYDNEGQYAGAIEIIRDITEMKRMEEELKESELHYRMLVQNIQFGISLIDTEWWKPS